MAVDRLVPDSTTPPPVGGDSYMNQVKEEIGALWDRAVITLTGVAGTNTITATVTPPLVSALVNGMMFILKPANTTTGPVTLNGNPVVDGEGNALTAANPLRINGSYLLKWDSTFSKYVVVGFFPAAAVTVGEKLLQYQSGITGVPNIDFVHGVGGVVFDGTYDRFKIRVDSLAPVTDDVEVWLRVGTGGGPSWVTSANYNWASTAWGNATPANPASNGDTKIIMTRSSGTVDVGNAAGETFSCEINFTNPTMTKFFDCTFHSVYRTAANGLGGAVGFGLLQTPATAITGVRIQVETGNISLAAAGIYGITKQ